MISWKDWGLIPIGYGSQANVEKRFNDARSTAPIRKRRKIRRKPKKKKKKKIRRKKKVRYVKKYQPRRKYSADAYKPGTSTIKKRYYLPHKSLIGVRRRDRLYAGRKCDAAIREKGMKAIRTQRVYLKRRSSERIYVRGYLKYEKRAWFGMGRMCRRNLIIAIRYPQEYMAPEERLRDWRLVVRFCGFIVRIWGRDGELEFRLKLARMVLHSILAYVLGVRKSVQMLPELEQILSENGWPAWIALDPHDVPSKVDHYSIGKHGSSKRTLALRGKREKLWALRIQKSSIRRKPRQPIELPNDAAASPGELGSP